MISLIATVRNEQENLAQWLASFRTQTLLPDEIIIVDGGSTDKTWLLLQQMAAADPRLKVFQKKGNIATGRNEAIRQARGEIIAVADAGCLYEIEWLNELVAPIQQGGWSWSATAFGPWFKDGDSWLIYLLASATIPAPQEFLSDWLPSSRSVAFKRDLWQTVDGYPEWIPYCEDVVFDLKIKKIAGLPGYIRKPLTLWRPRTTLGSYFKQLSNYTRSDGHGRLWFNRQLTRYLVYSLTVAILIGVAIGGWNWSLLVLAAGLGVYMKKFWQRWFIYSREKPWWLRIFGSILVPVIVGYGDVAKMVGWPRGVLERWSGKIKFKM